MVCPICGIENTDDWPVYIDDETIAFGGCQKCWEKQVDVDWWKMNLAISQIILRGEENE